MFVFEMKSGWPFVFLSLAVVAAAFAISGSGIPIGQTAQVLVFVFLSFFVVSLFTRS